MQRLLDAGALPVGKTNLDEFAMGSSCENSALGVTRNPWDLERVPGGSSGGSVAAVAAGEAVLALGSDTGGSIREPAAFCGVVGFKPTYGRVSRYGLIAFASSLDQIGPIARTVDEAARCYDVMAGHDPLDATSLERPVEHDRARRCAATCAACASGSCASFRCPRYARRSRPFTSAPMPISPGSDAELVDVALADRRLRRGNVLSDRAGRMLARILARFDGMRYGLRVTGADAAETYEQTRAAGFGDEVKRRILIGTHALSSGYYDAYYVRAQKARTLIAADFREAPSQSAMRSRARRRRQKRSGLPPRAIRTACT